MEAIKKKMQAMKVEKDNACDQADVSEEKMKAARVRAQKGEDEVEFEGGGTTTVLEFPVKKHHVRQGKVEVRIPVATSCNAAATNWSYSVMISISLIKVILGFI